MHEQSTAHSLKRMVQQIRGYLNHHEGASQDQQCLKEARRIAGEMHRYAAEHAYDYLLTYLTPTQVKLLCNAILPRKEVPS